MSTNTPVIFRAKEKVRKNLFFSTEYIRFGLKSADGSREILEPVYDAIHKTGSCYLAGKDGRWYCFDSEGRQLVLYRFKEGMDHKEVSPASTLVCCSPFRNAPEFIDGFACVQLISSDKPSWYVIDTAGRVILDALDSKPDIEGHGIFSLKNGNCISVCNYHARRLMFFPDPSSIAERIRSGSRDLTFDDGFMTLREYKVCGSDALQAFVLYLQRFHTDCGLRCIKTQSVENLTANDVQRLRFTYVFAPSAESKSRLYLDAEIENGIIFFSLRAAASRPASYQPGKRLILTKERIFELYVCSSALFSPADAEFKAFSLRSDNSIADTLDPYGPYCEGYTRE